MSVSSNTLFHFTNSLENIKGIIKNGFHSHFCDEYINFGKIKKTKKYKNFYIYDRYPMVSYCDAPLSQVSELIKSYGTYGIGMSKKWGKKKGINPVLYLQKNSLTARTIGKIIYDAPHTLDSTFEVYNHGFYLSAFVKNYRGIAHKNKLIDKISYNEREWRYVPELNYEDENINEYLPINYGKKHEKNAEEKLKKFALKFKAKHIKYIIVKNDAEISELVDFLKKEYPNYKHFNLLISRILTIKQIEEDF